ncbi:MAG: glutathione synthase [Desulfobacteraceae bacterium]|jgi:ribosomal protein S6--L-glutamate ligase|nr:glutathione synthase [Desulfobacteraceae bacterium]
MIVSFHPLLAGDCNLLCAGRDPGERERRAVQRAAAVILPQGCRQGLYEMARTHCANVFPDYEARFRFPGKIGQTRLFRHLGTPRPRSVAFENLAALQRAAPDLDFGKWFRLPFVFKFDWGGEGRTVYRVDSAAQFQALLALAEEFEQTGQHGFLLQEHVACGGRSLRVVIIGHQAVAYWRVQPAADRFGANLAQGAVIDRTADTHLRQAGIAAAREFCRRSGVNLAGIDLLFPTDTAQPTPLFLEINYFFGRSGLGGSNAYYGLLEKAVHRWLQDQGLRPSDRDDVR